MLFTHLDDGATPLIINYRGRYIQVSRQYSTYICSSVMIITSMDVQYKPL